MIPKKGIVAIIIVILIVAMLLVTGVLPGLSMVTTKTDNKNHDGIRGTGELIGPNNRKGFIISHTNTGFSQTITCIGKYIIDTWSSSAIQQYRYKVYGKKLIGDWEPLSIPGDTKKYISNQNPGVRNVGGMHGPGTWNADAYSFEFVGNEYKAVRVLFQATIFKLADPLGGFKWRTLQIDEAELFEGWGSITYPIINGLPQSTFEIGEKANIRIRTHYGGNVGENGKPWKVVMRWPKDRGGEPFEEKSYVDNVDTYFTFTVTEDMYSPDSDNSFEIEIYNTLVEKGELLVKAIDISAKAPSVVFMESPSQVENGDTINVKLSATVNSETQLSIDYFQVSVFYGAKDTLMPSDPFSNRWILPTYKIYDLTKSGDEYSYVLSFVADEDGYEGYVTVSAWAYDTEGRSSIQEGRKSTYIRIGSPVPEETIKDETDWDYGYGGHTEGWTPWDPSGGNWDDLAIYINWLGVLVAFLIVVVFAIAGFVIYKKPQMMFIFALVGLVVAVLVYVYYFTSMFTGG